MRLIDADELIKCIKIWEIGTSISSDQKEFIDCVNEQPTAFDVDKVIEQLEELNSVEQDDSVAEIVSTRIWNKAIQKSIGIVKKVVELNERNSFQGKEG